MDATTLDPREGPLNPDGYGGPIEGSGSWICALIVELDAIHVYPAHDAIAHEALLDNSCVCGTTVQAVAKAGGGTCPLVRHHAADGRGVGAR